MKIKICIWLFLILGTIAFSETSGINLNDILENLQNTHPQFKQDSLTLQAEEQKLDLLRTDASWYLLSSPFNKYYGEVSAQQFKADSANFSGMKIGIARESLETGGSIEFSLFSQVELLFNPFQESTPLGFKNGFELSFSQALLNNQTVLQRKHNLSSALIDNEIIRLSIKEKQKSLLYNATELFLNWVYTTEVVNIIKERIT
ncbi:MAG: hypothetical protein JXJ04_14130, partial [Spirochaetales bacterium]|nr:hypothetical protein [Spirochaetales bacterium]